MTFAWQCGLRVHFHTLPHISPVQPADGGSTYPGVWFRYDFSPIMVRLVEKRHGILEVRRNERGHVRRTVAGWCTQLRVVILWSRRGKKAGGSGRARVYSSIPPITNITQTASPT